LGAAMGRASDWQEKTEAVGVRLVDSLVKQLAIYSGLLINIISSAKHNPRGLIWFVLLIR